jgi:hypothetical protein
MGIGPLRPVDTRLGPDEVTASRGVDAVTPPVRLSKVEREAAKERREQARKRRAKPAEPAPDGLAHVDLRA